MHPQTDRGQKRQRDTGSEEADEATRTRNLLAIRKSAMSLALAVGESGGMSFPTSMKKMKNRRSMTIPPHAAMRWSLRSMAES